MTVIVKVGATENPHPEHKGESGYDYFGPMSQSQAEVFVTHVKGVWQTVPKKSFVYGEPECEILELRSDMKGVPIRRVIGIAETAAHNWYLVD